MRIVYFDESGDDGFPSYSSPLFGLTSIYMHYLSWKENYEAVLDFRKRLKTDFNFPVKLEFHTKYFLLDKNPYKDLNLKNDEKKEIVSLFCQLISELNLKVINTVIIKERLANPKFEVLNTALTYSIQRIENDLESGSNPNSRFMIITDPGRVGKMRKTTRKIQRINFIPSKYYTSNYRKEIKYLIEDPLPKDSKQSYFIQISDLISYLVTLFTIRNFDIAELPNRLKSYTRFSEIKNWLNILKPVFNLKATRSNEYGIVYHPK